MAPTALSRSRLFSGAAGKSLRPRASFTRCSKSSVGSKPRRESLNPFWPLDFPWHPPPLHPVLVKIGTIWVGKLTGLETANCSTVTERLAGRAPAAFPAPHPPPPPRGVSQAGLSALPALGRAPA